METLEPLIWHNERRVVKVLAPWEHNPRILTEKQAKDLKASLVKFNLAEVPVIDTNNRIVAGHQRIKTLSLLGRGAEEIDVRVPNRPLTDEEFREYNIRSNKNTGEWDFEMLANEWDEEKLLEYGFSKEDLGMSSAPHDAQDDDVPDEVKIKVLTVPGDLYELKTDTLNVRLLCGDCRKPEDVQKLMNGDKAHLLATDPPYNVDYASSVHHDPDRDDREIKNDKMSRADFVTFMTLTAGSFKAALVDGGMVFCFMSCQEWGTIMQIMEQPNPQTKKPDFHWSSTIIWNKDRMVMGRKDLHNKFEPIWYGWQANAARIHPVEDRTQTDVWDFERPARSDDHPCLSPNSLVVSSKGYQKISDIKIGDKMFCKDGQFHNVTDVSSHEYSEPIFRIGVRGTNLKVEATHNHPFLVLEKARNTHKFVEASDLKLGDYILTPVLTSNNERTEITCEMAFIVGLFTADGSYLPAGHGKNQYLCFSLHSNETDLIKKIKDAFVGKTSVYAYGGKGCNVVVFSPDWGAEMERLCGRYSHGKSLAAEIFTWPPEKQECFLSGYLSGDGNFIRGHWTAKTSSQCLAAQLAIIAERVNYKTCVRRYQPTPGELGIGDRKFKNIKPYYQIEFRKIGGRVFEQNHISIRGQKFIARRVTSINSFNYSGMVVNLTVEASHTFQTAIGMSHNTIKPVALIQKAVELFSNKDDLVVDFFNGSGTTGIACMKTGRDFYGMELEPKFVDVALRRWHEWLNESGTSYSITRNGDPFVVPELFEAEK